MADQDVVRVMDSQQIMIMLAQLSIAWRSMNDGDVYILDVGEIFYVWNGRLSSRTERIKVRLSIDPALLVFLAGFVGLPNLTINHAISR